MKALSSPPASQDFPPRGEGAVETAGPAVPAAAPSQVQVPAGVCHRLWRGRGGAESEGRRVPPGGPSSLALARVRRLRRGGRAVLLWSLGLYAAAQLALILALDHWHPTLTGSWRAHKWEQLRRLVTREPDRPLLVMLGSSRTDDACDASCFDGLPGPGGKPWLAYNFGVPMVGPLRERLYLDEMLAAGIRPRAVLIEFVPILLNRAQAGLISEENWTLAPWLSLSEVRSLWPYWSNPRRKGRDWLEARLAPWYAFRDDLFQSFCTELFPPAEGSLLPIWHWKRWLHDARGCAIPHSFSPEELAPSWVRVCRRYMPSLMHLEPGPLPIQALRDLLACCRREGIAAALVFMPESGLFRSWYRPGSLDEARRLFRELGREYGALTIDASDWIPDWEFGDGHHLLGEGARVFNDWLIAGLRPFLASPP